MQIVEFMAAFKRLLSRENTPPSQKVISFISGIFVELTATAQFFQRNH
jgi:hypothetical protein